MISFRSHTRFPIFIRRMQEGLIPPHWDPNTQASTPNVLIPGCAGLFETPVSGLGLSQIKDAMTCYNYPKTVIQSLFSDLGLPKPPRNFEPIQHQFHVTYV